MKKKKILNGIMVGLIIAIFACGIMAVGSVKGWFSSKQDNFASVTKVSGIASIERKGISYSLDENTALAEGDCLKTNVDAQVQLKAASNSLTLNEASEVSLNGIKDRKLQGSLTKGEIFATIGEGNDFEKITMGDYVITGNSGVFSANLQTGSADVKVFGGEVSVTQGTTTQIAKAGEYVSIIGSEMAVSELQIASLNDFNIAQLREANDNMETCFSNDDLDQVINDRAQEKIAAVEAGDKSEDEAAADSDEEKSGDTAMDGSSDKGSSKGTSSSDKKGSSNEVTTSANGTTQETSGSDNGSNGGNSGSSGSNGHTCTIQIVCNTILNNMGDLKAGKEPYVPSSGVILGTSTIEFTEGETVFDVLKRACTRGGIQLEYTYTPAYGSYYIQGINNLYEFDCGKESGWMYKVNGWFPNYGCSSYTLKDGDTIVWCYTCKGLGADVGGGM